MVLDSDESDVEASEDDEPVVVAPQAKGGGSSSTDKGLTVTKEVFILIERIERK